jgi:hypothetical protein
MARKATQETVTYTPKELAEKLEMSPKRLRAYLRQNFPRTSEEKNTNWQIPKAVADKVIAHYESSKSEADEDES